MPDVPTIHEMLDQILDYNRRSTALVLALKGEAAPGDTLPGTTPPKPSRYVNGMTPPDDLGRVELELIDRLRAEFGDAPNGYKIPSLWYVPGVVVSHLPPAVQGDYQKNVAEAQFNENIAYTFKDGRGWGGGKIRVKAEGIPGSLCWNGSLAQLEASLRARIKEILSEGYPPYKSNPDVGVLNTVAGYLKLPSFTV